MVARAETLGDTGASAPRTLGRRSRKPGPACDCSPIRQRCDRACPVRIRARKTSSAACPGVELLSVLDLEAVPPFNYAHDHFGYRDRLSQPVIEGGGEDPTPGSGAPLKAGEFIPRVSGRIWRDRR